MATAGRESSGAHLGHIFFCRKELLDAHARAMSELWDTAQYRHPGLRPCAPCNTRTRFCTRPEPRSTFPYMSERQNLRMESAAEVHMDIEKSHNDRGACKTIPQNDISTEAPLYKAPYYIFHSKRRPPAL